MTSDDDRLLQDIVCGDATEHDPTVQARLDANPRLQIRLAALRTAQQKLDALGDVTASPHDEVAALVAPEDRRRVAGAIAPRPPHAARRLWLALASLAAAAVVFFMLYTRGDGRQAPDGRLGGTAPVTLHRQGDRWRLVVHDALPPGTSYHLRLELADGTSSTAASESLAWAFPDAWNQSILRSNPARLVIEWDDGTGLFVRRVLQLP